MADLIPIVLVPGPWQLGAQPPAGLSGLVAAWLGHCRQPDPRRQHRGDGGGYLAEAPPRFSLIGHSLGGYIVLEIMRQAPDRVARLALMNTQARTDPPEVTERRKRRSRRIERRAISRRP